MSKTVGESVDSYKYSCIYYTSPTEGLTQVKSEDFTHIYMFSLKWICNYVSNLFGLKKVKKKVYIGDKTGNLRFVTQRLLGKTCLCDIQTLKMRDILLLLLNNRYLTIFILTRKVLVLNLSTICCDCDTMCSRG